MFTKLFVGALPFSYTNDELRALCAGAGTVVSAVMVHDPDRGRSRGFGFVEMQTPEEARAAIEKLNGLRVGEKNIFVTEARERKPSAKPADAERKPFARKAGRPSQQSPYRNPGWPAGQPSERPSWPPRRNSEPGASARPFDGPPRRYKGSRPFQRDNRQPGSFGAPNSPSRSGFSRPNKWEPTGDGKRSFSSPRVSHGDFGPSRRSTGLARPSNRPPKKKFWSKFDKKKD